MPVQIPQNRRNDLQVASAVISFLLTGAFVLQALGIPPILEIAYTELFATDGTPVFVGLALGAAGVFTVIYQLLYASVIAPMKCMFGVNLPASATVDLGRVDRSDFVVLMVIMAVYGWMVVVRDIQPSANVMLGGFLLIITAMLFRVIPRVVAGHIDPDSCFYALRIILIGIIASTVLFIPTLYVVAHVPAV